MCGGYRLEADAEDLAEFFEAEMGQLELPLKVERFPGQTGTIVVERQAASGERQRLLGPARWGLVPRWARSEDIGNKLYNARSESLEDKPSFRESFRKRRCLVPVSAFYEWRKRDGGRGSERHEFGPTEQGLLALAGLWDNWRDAEGRKVGTFTVITTAADAVVEPVHHRMPLIVPRAQFGPWLMPGPLSPDVLGALRMHGPTSAVTALAATASAC